MLILVVTLDSRVYFEKRRRRKGDARKGDARGVRILFKKYIKKKFFGENLI